MREQIVAGNLAHDFMRPFFSGHKVRAPFLFALCDDGERAALVGEERRPQQGADHRGVMDGGWMRVAAGMGQKLAAEMPGQIDALIEALRPLGLVDVSRTGVAAMTRGAGVM